MTSEELTAKRRAERKQFKLDRARAIAAVAEEAEMIFATEGRVIKPALSGPAIPSAATWKPEPEQIPGSPVTPTIEEEDLVDEEPLEDVEHLQLTFQEAFFLLWNLDCLSVLDPHTVCVAPSLQQIRPTCLKQTVMSLQNIWIAFQTAHLPPVPNQPLQFDNPFLVNYVVYHHYRSLGWVVKGGIKFCVDYLLYKRGPVFNHAEYVRLFPASFTPLTNAARFALVVCPVYEDPEDQKSSIFDLQNSSPFPWSWLSTINRVNSQVQKVFLTFLTSHLVPDG